MMPADSGHALDGQLDGDPLPLLPPPASGPRPKSMPLPHSIPVRVRPRSRKRSHTVRRRRLSTYSMHAQPDTMKVMWPRRRLVRQFIVPTTAAGGWAVICLLFCVVPHKWISPSPSPEVNP